MRHLLHKLRTEPWTAAALLVIGLFMFLRIWRLGYPAETVFDEVYFPKMASQYLVGEQFFDIHPPLGKLMIAAAELIFRDQPIIGWRAVSLVTGLAMIPAAYWTTLQVFADRRAGLLASLFVAIDGLFIVYSRTGLMDGFMLLFGLLAVGCAWRFRRRRLAGQVAWGPLIAAGFWAGLALAIKWIGAGFLPLTAGIVALTVLTTAKGRHRWDVGVFLGSFVLLPALLYILPFMANWQQNFWAEFALWHRQSWDYNVHLNATHPYASQWWSWPFLLRPIWFYYKVIDGQIIGVDAIGNPIVWWGSTLAVVYSLLLLAYDWLTRQAERLIARPMLWPLLTVVVGWAAFYLPWTRVGRVLFLYHYFASYLFALLLMAYWLSQAWAARSSRVAVVIFLVLAVAAAVAFAPIWIAYPISQQWFDSLMWLKKGWI